MEGLKENKKIRISWIDIAKGLGIFFIVMQHVKNSGPVRDMMTYSVPIFFFLSGMTFCKKNGQKDFFINKIKRLYIPYLIVSIISIFIYLLLGKYIGAGVGLNGKDILDNLFGMIYANADCGNMMWNRPLWFIPTLFVALIITNIIEQIKNRDIKIIYIGLLTLLGMILASFNINLPFQLETALSMLIWIYIGMYFKPILFKIEKNKKLVIVLLIVSVCLGLFFRNT